MRQVLTGLALLTLTGCITVYSPPQPAPAQPTPVVSTPHPSPSPSPQAPQTEADRLTVSQTIQLCKAVQASAELPITCSVTYLEGKPSMFVGFQDLATATNYWGAMSEVVSSPFCEAANAGNRQAFVFVALAQGGVARLFSCETYEWTDWFSYADDSY